MFKNVARVAVIVVVSIGIHACNGYNKVLKSTDLEYKYAKALEYYEDGNYYNAYPLIEELAAIYRGQKRSEKLFFMYAYCDYYLEDYLLASHRFSEFTKTFPTSSYTEECYFMSAYSLYKLSPPPKLDQSNTYLAISELQKFVDQYPRSTRVDSCNDLIRGLEFKIEDKVIAGADQYKKMQNYTSAVLTYENVLNDFPDTRYREKIYYNIFDSYYLLSLKSVPQKKKERIEDAMEAYVNFADRFPESKHMVEAQDSYARLQKMKLKIENQEQ